jgi:manganese-dependent ADP-ribose/CDP-alcohol diphosphatase
MSDSANSSVIRFGVVTDIHFTTGSQLNKSSKRIINYAAEELRLWIESSRNKYVDFLLQLGDLINGTEELQDEEIEQVTAILHEYPGTIHHVIGNHCLALPQKKLLQALQLKAPYYSFSIKGFRFIVLDGMDVSVLHKTETPEDTKTLKFYHAQFDDDPSLHDYCGAIGYHQKNWLKKELHTAKRAGEMVIALCHFPLLPQTTDQNHGLLWNHREIVALLSSSTELKVCISGHYHHGGYLLHNDIHFVVLPAFVNRQEHPEFSWGRIELHSDKMVIRNQENKTIYDLSFN